ncbi:serine/threonine-protein kinase ppk30 [Verticillium alfalfae VaMs.102]|uniref:non-specific serine/threonine protein kinase n=1 Tax=Verticillium alfalfae (strain VaMs.102 / ATCC MYA-4576 / FGSC 10136) TaxID=526221 RepID=C9SPY2_VERA1|nr:serine/threonine-protein kinase ppk30 [Verticillium alfalfae VaMs.102]EEY20907.1 serine/threonine-protein kinase ppk30 [Verticillium alfalfae VaMs.102]
MASYGHHAAAAAPRPAQPANYPVPVPGHASAAPAGTFAPGTKIQVGSHRVVIQKYLSEGGFAHVYLVKLPKPLDGTDLAVLKRVAVPDKEALRSMRIEVETMKRLKGHRMIVTYIDSHASELRGGGFEVFLLMEYCNGGGLIDFMNTRLQHRLTEPEILHIFTDVAEGVACMHYLKPPLLHRDLKVENVLILSQGSKKRFKLCDFGSAAPPKPAPQTVVECRLLDEDVQKHTTLQYRSPEMIDVYRKQPIDEKSDIWALGVLLYKLCYYTTPFEDQGQLAILNASFRFHSHPVFSDRLKKLIGMVISQSRPNVYQVLREACAMQGREVPIHDIYAARAQSEPRRSDKPQLEKSTPPVVGAVFSPPPQETQTIPEVVPMRRGRLPVASTQSASQSQRPSPSPGRVTSGDPFAALDAKANNNTGAGDELSSRFPTLDQFSLLHNNGGGSFDFTSPATPPAAQQSDLKQKVTEHLADEAFAKPSSPPEASESTRSHTIAQPVSLTQPPASVEYPATATVSLKKTASAPPKPSEMSRASAIITQNPELRAISSQSTQKYVSTGTMTSTPPPSDKAREPPAIWRVPSTDHHRSTSLPRKPDDSHRVEFREGGISSGPLSRQNSYQSHTRHPSSSRPSLEGGRPSADHLGTSLQPRMAIGRQRPASTHLESSIDYLRERQMASKPSGSPSIPSPRLPERPADKSSSPALISLGPEDETNIESNVEFLRSMEDAKKDRGSWHGKKSSVSSTSGSRNILAGKFGDAFKIFEGKHSTPAIRTPSPLKEHDRRDLTPIAGSEATDGRSDDGRAQEDQDDMTPEMRRDLERQRLAEEERRVELAQAEYRQRIASKPQRADGGAAASPPKRSQLPANEQLVGTNIPGRPALDMTAKEKDDYVEDFSKRFPSLSAIEMVERDIDTEPRERPGR